jgi:adenylate kinase
LTFLILITGTPGVGKSILAAKLSKKLDCLHVDISTLVKTKRLYTRVDKKRRTLVADERRLRLAMDKIIRVNKNRCIVISTHYLGNFLPTRQVKSCFVLRLNPEKLRRRLISRRWSRSKIRENVEAELIGVCLFEAVGLLGLKRVREIDTTGKSSAKVLGEVTNLLSRKKRDIGNAGVVDWLKTHDLGPWR